MKTYLILVIAETLLVFSACKNAVPDQSASKNVETASQGVDDSLNGSVQAGKVEYCLADHGTESKTVASAILKKLPTRLAKEYENVKVTIMSDIDKIHKTCLDVNQLKSSSKSANDEKYIACWGPTSKTDLVAARPEIFLLDDVDIVHSNLIAMVISSYSELYIDQIMTRAAEKMDDKDPLKSALMVFKEARKNLALEFAKILPKDPNNNVSGLYKSKFINDANASDAALAADTGFQNFVLAEVGESAYCSDKTRNVLSGEKYKAISLAFKPFDDFFGSVQ